MQCLLPFSCSSAGRMIGPKQMQKEVLFQIKLCCFFFFFLFFKSSSFIIIIVSFAKCELVCGPVGPCDAKPQLMRRCAVNEKDKNSAKLFHTQRFTVVFDYNFGIRKE